MNKTTVKRGIGAVILALIAAALLAILLKDKATQRQDVVDMALPGADGSIETSGGTTRLPELSTDNSGNGTVIAQAGQEAADGASASVSNAAQQTTDAVSSAASDATGKVIASATAAGAAAAGTAAAAGDAAEKTISFDVRPTQQASSASGDSGEFRELDLVNNGAENAPETMPVATDSSSGTAQSASSQSSTQQSSSSSDQGTVIASTSARSTSSSASSSGAGQARLIDEKRSTAPQSARTAQVITRTTSSQPSSASQASKPAAPAPAAQAKNGYAIQLLATSSASRANDLKNVMAGEGYPTYVTKTQQNGKLLYRVRIGQYTTRAAAASAQAAMKRRYKKNTYVNGSAIVAR